MEELLNCVMEICCTTPDAQEALVKMFKLNHCHTPEECANMIFEYFTLAPASFRQVKKDIAKIALTA